MDMYAPICFIEKDHWDEALQLVKKVFMEFEAPDYGEEGVADFMHAMGDESYLDMHRFYGAYEDDKLGFVDTAEEQITNGVRYYPMERS